MRVVEWMDKEGFKRRSLVKDGDPDEAAEGGIPMDPPDVRLLDWEGVARDLHNGLLAAGLLTWADVQAKQRSSSLTAIINGAMKRRLIQLYREKVTVEEENYG